MIQNFFSYVKWLWILVVILTTSCSPVKFVPKESYLLNKVEVDIDNKDINKDDVKLHIKQKGNYKILGFAKFHLGLYNLSSKKNPEAWLKKIGEPPEIFDYNMMEASKNQIEQYLGYKGFFRASVDADVELKEKKRKANVKYKITTGEQYNVKEINYHFGDSALEKLFFKDSVRSFVKPGSPFDYDLLDKQRDNIVNLYKNEGYYFFSKDEIRYTADSTAFDKEIILDLYIGYSAEREKVRDFVPYYINNFKISVLPGTISGITGRDNLTQFEDTLNLENFVLYTNKNMQYRPELFEGLLKMKRDSLYRLRDDRHTFDAFNRLRQFRFIDIQFDRVGLSQDTNLLDCSIRLAPLNKQLISFDVEGTNTSGNMGVAGNIGYKHRNMFNGAEVFQLKLKGAMERQKRGGEGGPNYFNTREIGAETNLLIPKIIGPRQIVTAFSNYLPQTMFSLGYNFQQRPEYTRTISNIKYGYIWMTSEVKSHLWNVLDFNMVNLSSFDPSFISRIKDLYIKSSFTDHLILATNYSFVYNTQLIGKRQDYTYLRFNVESAGNLLYLYSKIFDKKLIKSKDLEGGNPQEFYRVFKTRYAQYVKSDLEIRYGILLDKYNTIVGRAFCGVGFPYGNFDVLPFEKQYFTGGANGIRAWQVRSLGPGTYKGPENVYQNQSSDIKLELNLEYRFKLIGFWEGALFLDAGNIWAINEKDNRPGAQFKLDQFYKQLALGTGVGCRFDFNYFLFRIDLGMKLRDPAQNLGNGWIVGNRSYASDDFHLSFAIGYPF